MDNMNTFRPACARPACPQTAESAETAGQACPQTAESAGQACPRPEYPRPQMVRDAWVNLNGQWDFAFDFGRSGRDRRMFTADAPYGQTITVPFCPESRLSGIEYKDFMICVWYRRHFTVPADWDLQTGRVLLHFGAVDYAAEVWVNGVQIGAHLGGYTPFEFDITAALLQGGGPNRTEMAGQADHVVCVCAEDDLRSGAQPRGKQSSAFYSHDCDYTRTTGIWQTVWMEYVPRTYIRRVFLTPDVNNEKLDVRVEIDRYVGSGRAYSVRATVFDGGKMFSVAEAVANWRDTRLSVPMHGAALWEPGKPYLYDLTLELRVRDGVADCTTGTTDGGADGATGGDTTGGVADCVHSYFGMRSVALTENCVLLNGKPVFQRLVLDQGFYPDGIYTAPSDGALRADIERSMAMGFNGARLHQKVFEPRFLFWADRLGYLCWGEHANWGYDVWNPGFLSRFLREWTEVVERDFSHPAVIGWCPFNETAGTGGDDTVGTVYDMTKRLDPTRPVIDTSGWSHHLTRDGRPGSDIYDFHDYEQNAAVLAQRLQPYTDGVTPPHAPNTPREAWFPDTPYFISEFGGTRWAPDRPGWGYGEGPTSETEFIDRFGALVTTLLRNPKLCAFCYTQLTDIEQEVNGLYT